MNTLLNGLKNQTNFGYTENGAVKRNSTKSMLLDMFSMGAAMRNRSDNDVILMFKNAYDENPEYALKCLFAIIGLPRTTARQLCVICPLSRNSVVGTICIACLELLWKMICLLF